jgi:hypothetical protein
MSGNLTHSCNSRPRAQTNCNRMIHLEIDSLMQPPITKLADDDLLCSEHTIFDKSDGDSRAMSNSQSWRRQAQAACLVDKVLKIVRIGNGKATQLQYFRVVEDLQAFLHVAMDK